MEQSSGEAPGEKRRFVEDLVNAEEDIVAETPRRHRRKRRRRDIRMYGKAQDEEKVTNVPDSEMETATDMEVTEIDDDNINTSVLHPEREAETLSTTTRTRCTGGCVTSACVRIIRAVTTRKLVFKSLDRTCKARRAMTDASAARRTARSARSRKRFGRRRTSRYQAALKL